MCCKGEDQYEQQKEWEEEQAHLESLSAEAIADAEARERAQEICNRKMLCSVCGVEMAAFIWFSKLSGELIGWCGKCQRR